jgi:signal peptidase I
MNFFEKRKIQKQLKNLLHHARTMRCSREDIMAASDLAVLDDLMSGVRAALKAGNIETMKAAGEALDACLVKLNPPKPMAGWRENFDVLVVAISVAMAFRAYFYQPFKIPTGSMQPTLYGIHAEARPASQMTLLDQQPFKLGKWLVTGESFHVVRAKARGTAVFTNGNGKKPGYMAVIVAGMPHYVPNDALEFDPTHRGWTLKGGIKDGAFVREGDVLWSGVVVSGDFVFVNRWLWNFRHPQRGEVMVFATTGINPSQLQQGTHYIKRMMGLPNETLQVKTPNLLVNGVAVTEPYRVGLISRREKMAPWAPPYAGFNPGQSRHSDQSLTSEDDVVKLRGDQYYAMGDNSLNSFDSRYWGPVPERNLLGPATVVYWPFTSPRFGFIR